MSARTFSFIFSVLMLAAHWGAAQDAKQKPLDTVKVVNRYYPTGLRLGTDLISIIKSKVTHNFSGWETNADVDFYRYFLTVDLGAWSRRDSITAFQATSGKGYYENQGHYFRIGGDINFLLKDPERNMFFIGFRYGHSSFNESLKYAFNDALYQNIQKSIISNHLKGHWGEITTGIRVKVFPGFWMGYTMRLKLAPGVHGGNTQLKSFDMPGYGLVSHGNYWGMNYQVFWRIPFRKIK